MTEGASWLLAMWWLKACCCAPYRGAQLTEAQSKHTHLHFVRGKAGGPGCIPHRRVQAPQVLQVQVSELMLVLCVCPSQRASVLMQTMLGILAYTDRFCMLADLVYQRSETTAVAMPQCVCASTSGAKTP